MYVSNYIRKIDELGRIVIPKEVRNKLKIQENENILINLEKEKIIISKYSFLNNYQNFIKELCNKITEIYKVEIIITDRDKIVFSNNISNYCYEYHENILNDSTIIGTINIYSNYNEDFSKLLKLISQIISIFLTTTQST